MWYRRALELHSRLRGKIEIRNKVRIRSMDDLSLIYTPGVASVAQEIARDKSKAYEYTLKHNSIAIVTDGSRVLGLGNIGAEAALPVMEGKAVIFKEFAGIDAFPLCLATDNKDEIISVVKAISPSFAAVSIEDIESPKCLQIVDSLQEQLSIPVFHDDQHGTAVVVLAALINALRLVGKSVEGARITIVGAGAAGYGIVNIISKYNKDGRFNPRNIIVLDSKGIISRSRLKHESNANMYKLKIAELTNTDDLNGSLIDAVRGSDVLIGVSGRSNLISRDMIRLMAKDAIVFALTNPEPEIMPNIAKNSGARIVATGRSDYYNQINNALVFPNIIRAVIDSDIKRIEWDMLVDVAYAIAEYTRSNRWFNERHIIPSIMDKGLSRVIISTIKAR